MSDCVITIDRKNWSGRYPDDVARAYGLISYNVGSGMLAGVEEFIANSVQEGVGIPLKEANADTLRAMRHRLGTRRDAAEPAWFRDRRAGAHSQNL